jgi:hypothetical protein
VWKPDSIHCNTSNNSYDCTSHLVQLQLLTYLCGRLYNIIHWHIVSSSIATSTCASNICGSKLGNRTAAATVQQQLPISTCQQPGL